MAQNLFADYFCQEEESDKVPDAVNRWRDFYLNGSTLHIDGENDIMFPRTKVEFDSLKINNMTDFFVKQNKPFTNFLHKNGSNVIELVINKRYLSHKSLSKILK